MSKIEAGRYKAKPIAGSFQYGLSKNQNEQIAVDLLLSGGQTVTAFMNFSEAARPYSEERLVALGWGGPGTAIDEALLINEVDVDISYRMYEGKEQVDVNIVTGGGKVKMKTTMEDAAKKAFLARLSGVAAAPAAKLDF